MIGGEIQAQKMIQDIHSYLQGKEHVKLRVGDAKARAIHKATLK